MLYLQFAPNRGTQLNDEFSPNSSPFPLVVSFILLLLELAPMVPA